MDSLTTWLRLYCLLKIIVKLDSYVLLAANADDFHNIAKQIVPGALANKLARLASASAKKTSTERSEETEYYYESEAEEADEETKEDSVVEEKVKDYERSREDTYVNEWKTRVNFDELVERVKDRLAKEITVKLKKHVWDPKQSIYNGLNQKYTQNENIKNPIHKNVNYETNSNQNNLKQKKTYGFNNSKNNLQPDKDSQNVNSYIDPDFQIDPQTSPVENIDQDKESFENNQFIFNGENLQGANVSNAYVDDNSNENDYFNKEKHQSNQMNHEERNNMYHLQNNKDLNGAEERQKNMQNGEFSKQYVDFHGNSPKSAENYNSESKNGGAEPDDINNHHVFKQFNTNQKKLNGTYNTGNNKPALYEEFDLVSKRKNDSYEDYVIPSSQNKYASEETSSPTNHDRAKLKPNLSNNSEKSIKDTFNNQFQNVRPLKHEKQLVKTEEQFQEDYSEVTDKWQEIKAKTESLLYNYDEVKPKPTKHNRIKGKTVSPISTIKKPRAKGTMIPTREYYKMASPNYYISIPTVVEKYDPNEPLPEKDREREVIKHFVNPPARINKKIKLT